MQSCGTSTQLWFRGATTANQIAEQCHVTGAFVTIAHLLTSN